MCDLTWTVVSDVIRTLAPLAALVTVAAGWFLVNRQNNLRESRKETRQLVDRTLDRLEEAVDVATKYQCGAGDEKLRHIESWKVLLALEQIGSNIGNLRRRNIDT